MKALRHVAGILVATLSAFFLLMMPLAALEPLSDHPWWLLAGCFLGLGVLPLWGAVVLLRPSLKGFQQRPCPKCGSTERVEAGVLVRTHSYLMHQVGGWLFASLWGASRERQMRCLHCDTLYFCETRDSRIGGVALWVFVLLMLVMHLLGELAESGDVPMH